ncbi:MAG: double zinc ribbon domain-containing protein [Pyrinomonadaceae bacterium]
MSLSALASQLYDATLAIVYPQACAVCGDSVESRAGGIACALCWEATPLLSGSEILCGKCGRISHGKIADEKREQVHCGFCDDDAFTAARSCGVYEGALRASLLELKRKPQVPQRLASLLAAACRRPPLTESTMIVPVPLHPERQHERGFNQAAILARSVAKFNGLPVDDHSLVRLIHTNRHRTGMDARARRESVAGAFAVKRRRSVQGQRILLVDDVFTTGATVSACSAALIAAGAEKVFVLTAARPQTY